MAVTNSYNVGLPEPVQAGDAITDTWANAVVSSIRATSKDIQGRKPRRGGSAVSGPDCPFGELMLDNDGDMAIRGGVIYAGDKTFIVPHYKVDTETDKSVNVYIELDVIVNTDDDGQLLLPNVKTSNGTPSWNESSTESPQPDNTNPSLPDGDGTIRIFLGQLTVLDHIISLDYFYSCGNITVNHCNGYLSTTRESYSYYPY